MEEAPQNGAAPPEFSEKEINDFLCHFYHHTYSVPNNLNEVRLLEIIKIFHVFNGFFFSRVPI